MNISNNGFKTYLKSDIAKVVAGAFVLALVVSTFSYALADLGAQNIEYTTTESGNAFPNFSYYNAPNSGEKNFNWSMNITNHGPGDMHLVVMGFHDDEAGNEPTIKHPFSVNYDGKVDYNEGESGIFNFSYKTTDVTCGRVQIDVGVIDERYPDYHDTNIFAILVDYGTDCTTPPPPAICSEDALVTVTQALPATMAPGASAIFKMKVKNTGDTKWYNGSYFQFVRVPENITTGLQITPSYGHLPHGMNPGDEVTWEFTATAPTALGSYSLDMQMVHRANAEYLKPDGTTCTAPTVDIYFGNQGSVNTRVVTSGNPNLTIQKTVRNATNFQIHFVESVSAMPGDAVEFRMVVTNNGNAVAKNVNVTDALPAHFSGTPTTFDLGNMSPGAANTVTFMAQAGPASEFPTGTSEWINTATVSASNHGNVSDTAKVVVTKTPPGTVVLTIEKLVRNVSDNQSNFVDSTNADPGETVEFRIQVTNTSSVTATSVNVTDALPAHFTASGSTTFNLGDIAAGSNKVVTLQAVTGPASEFPTGTSEWINTATVSASNHGNVSDTAKVVVTRSTSGQPSLQINKTVKNISSGTGSYVENVNALSGDVVEFRIELVNNGSTNATNVTITDTLPNNFSANTALSFDVGTLNAGQNYVATVRATAASEGSFPFGSSNWINTATASSANHGNVSDTASVTVNRSSGGGGGGGSTYLSINKFVRNLTASQLSYYDNVSAQSGDRVMFRITVSNPGSGTANNVRISDSLPFGLNYEANSFNIDGNIYYGNPFNGWISVGNLSSNDTRVITFVAVVNSSGTLTNVATATADNTGTVNDNASVSASQVAGGNINLQFSKKAYNITKNADASTVVADPKDVIVYTLGVFNSGNTAATNYTIEDDISDVLQIATLTDFGGGQFNMGGLSIKWQGLSIPANSKVEKTFSVTVKDSIPTNTDYVMSNTYGNSVNINVRRPQVQGIFVAPKTGNPITMSIIFALLTLISFVFYKKGLFGLVLKKVKIAIM